MEKKMLKGFALLTLVAGSVFAAGEQPTEPGFMKKAWNKTSETAKAGFNGTINHRGKVSGIAALIVVAADQAVLYKEAKAAAKNDKEKAEVKYFNNPFKAKRTSKRSKAIGVIAALLSASAAGVVVGEKAVYNKLVFPRTKKGIAISNLQKAFRSKLDQRKLAHAARIAKGVKFKANKTN